MEKVGRAPFSSRKSLPFQWSGVRETYLVIMAWDIPYPVYVTRLNDVNGYPAYVVTDALTGKTYPVSDKYNAWYDLQSDAIYLNTNNFRKRKKAEEFIKQKGLEDKIYE